MSTPLQKQRNKQLKELQRQYPMVDTALVAFLYSDNNHDFDTTVRTLALLTTENTQSSTKPVTHAQATGDKSCATQTYTNDTQPLADKPCAEYTRTQILEDLVLTFPSLSRDFLELVLEENANDCGKTFDFLSDYMKEIERPMDSPAPTVASNDSRIPHDTTPWKEYTNKGVSEELILIILEQNDGDQASTRYMLDLLAGCSESSDNSSVSNTQDRSESQDDFAELRDILLDVDEESFPLFLNEMFPSASFEEISQALTDSDWDFMKSVEALLDIEERKDIIAKFGAHDEPNVEKVESMQEDDPFVDSLKFLKEVFPQVSYENLSSALQEVSGSVEKAIPLILQTPISKDNLSQWNKGGNRKPKRRQGRKIDITDDLFQDNHVVVEEKKSRASLSDSSDRICPWSPELKRSRNELTYSAAFPKVENTIGVELCNQDFPSLSDRLQGRTRASSPKIASLQPHRKEEEEEEVNLNSFNMSKRLAYLELKKRYSGSSPSLLMSVFASSGYNLDATIESLKEMHFVSPEEQKERIQRLRLQMQKEKERKAKEEVEEAVRKKLRQPAPTLVKRNPEAEEVIFTRDYSQVVDVRLASLSSEELKSSVNQTCQLRDAYYREALRAYQAGKANTARQLSSFAKIQADKMVAAQSILGDRQYRHHQENRERPSSRILDLHGYRVKEALQVMQRVLSLYSSGTLEVITGAGNHSVGGQPRLKPAVKKFLTDNMYKYTAKEGSFIVFF
eukprot:TRINITY_DN8656_c0_g1_i1.p1 TRINITY_DN8656_c0_g1~~TRINITY_DN8656_c0_g1_i1.p1  ORF type:complete len:737 (-),score=176.69 TRINITY_DN8656_c0_g1_i1:7-2217(-)